MTKSDEVKSRVHSPDHYFKSLTKAAEELPSTQPSEPNGMTWSARAGSGVSAEHRMINFDIWLTQP